MDLSRYRSRVDAALLVMLQAMSPLSPTIDQAHLVAGAGRVVLRPVDGVFVPARRHPERLVAAQQRLA